jgi:hypothetical protein
MKLSKKVTNTTENVSKLIHDQEEKQDWIEIKVEKKKFAREEKEIGRWNTIPNKG